MQMRENDRARRFNHDMANIINTRNLLSAHNTMQREYDKSKERRLRLLGMDLLSNYDVYNRDIIEGMINRVIKEELEKESNTRYTKTDNEIMDMVAHIIKQSLKEKMKKTSEEIKEKTSEEIKEKTSEEIKEKTSEEIKEKTSEEIKEKTSEEKIIYN